MNDVHTWLRWIANDIRIISDMHELVSTGACVAHSDVQLSYRGQGDSPILAAVDCQQAQGQDVPNGFPFEEPDAAQCAKSTRQQSQQEPSIVHKYHKSTRRYCNSRYRYIIEVGLPQNILYYAISI